MIMMPKTDFQELISDVVYRSFSEGAVRDVHVWRDTDLDGEGYFRVMVVMGRPFGEEDLQNMVSLGRHIRSRLADVDETDFPLVDFVTPADAMMLKRAAV